MRVVMALGRPEFLLHRCGSLCWKAEGDALAQPRDTIIAALDVLFAGI